MTDEEFSRLSESSADFKRPRRAKTPAVDLMKLDRLPPHSAEAEQGVLGCVLLSPNDGMSLCEEMGVVPDSFYDLRHQSLWECFVAMRHDDDRIDLITVQQRLRDAGTLEGVGGLAYLSSLMDAVPSAANLSCYMDIIREKHVLRTLLRTCTQVIARIHEHEGEVDQLVDEVEREIIRISQGRLSGQNGNVLNPAEAVRVFTDDLQRRFNLQGALSGIGTGFHRLDRMTGGLQAGELAIIGARPSAGKTALACSIILQACINSGTPTAFVTCEMSPASILRRIASGYLKIPASQLRDGSFNEGEFKRLVLFNSKVGKSRLHFIDGVAGITAARISKEISRLVRKQGVKLVVIDYLQKVRPAHSCEKRTYEVGSVSEALKGMAASLNVAVLALAQLNREPDKDKGRQPRASDLADSAQIERDADLIGLIHRPRTKEDPNGERANLIVAKQRDGEVGLINMRFSPRFVLFTEESQIEE